MLTTIRDQFRGYAAPLSAVLIPVIMLMIWAFVQKSIPLAHLLQDPAASHDLPFYLGLISHLGILMWVMSGAIAVTTSLLGLHRGSESGPYRFLLGCGLFSIMLGLDDLFLLHEVALPSIGIAEWFVFLVHGFTLVTIVVVERRAVMATEFTLLTLAGAFFGLAVLVDEGPEMGLPLLWRLGHSPLEDVVKIIAISVWSLYLVRTSYHRMCEGKSTTTTD